jgi:hypothetical protein
MRGNLNYNLENIKQQGVASSNYTLHGKQCNLLGSEIMLLGSEIMLLGSEIMLLGSEVRQRVIVAVRLRFF